MENPPIEEIDNVATHIYFNLFLIYSIYF